MSISAISVTTQSMSTAQSSSSVSSQPVTSATTQIVNTVLTEQLKQLTISTSTVSTKDDFYKKCYAVFQERASKGGPEAKLMFYSFALEAIQNQDCSIAETANILLTEKLIQYHNPKILEKEEKEASNLNFKDLYKGASSGNPKALDEYVDFARFLGVGKDIDTEVDTEEGTVPITIYWDGLFPGMIVGGAHNKEVNERLLKAIATTK